MPLHMDAGLDRDLGNIADGVARGVGLQGFWLVTAMLCQAVYHALLLAIGSVAGRQPTSIGDSARGFSLSAASRMA